MLEVEWKSTQELISSTLASLKQRLRIVIQHCRHDHNLKLILLDITKEILAILDTWNIKPNYLLRDIFDFILNFKSYQFSEIFSFFHFHFQCSKNSPRHCIHFHFLYGIFLFQILAFNFNDPSTRIILPFSAHLTCFVLFFNARLEDASRNKRHWRRK